MTAEVIAHALGGRRCGAGWPPPVHWDLGTLWESLRVKYEILRRPVPQRWIIVHRLMAVVLKWGAR
ncbi:MAG: hypothetical protein AAB654_22605 [Acidobacteriota bacterium]